MCSSKNLTSSCVSWSPVREIAIKSAFYVDGTSPKCQGLLNNNDDFYTEENPTSQFQLWVKFFSNNIFKSFKESLCFLYDSCEFGYFFWKMIRRHLELFAFSWHIRISPKIPFTKRLYLISAVSFITNYT